MDRSETTPEVVDVDEPETGSLVESTVKGRKGRRKRQWKDLSQAQRTRIVTQGLIQVVLMAWMLWDLAHRPDDQIKGKKRLWIMAAFVQPFGPIAYIIFGRKR